MGLMLQGLLGYCRLGRQREDRLWRGGGTAWAAAVRSLVLDKVDEMLRWPWKKGARLHRLYVSTVVVQARWLYEHAGCTAPLCAQAQWLCKHA
eukprot:230985-Chlamydomonas_euryale.AAC.1